MLRGVAAWRAESMERNCSRRAASIAATSRRSPFPDCDLLSPWLGVNNRANCKGGCRGLVLFDKNRPPAAGMRQSPPWATLRPPIGHGKRRATTTGCLCCAGPARANRAQRGLRRAFPWPSATWPRQGGHNCAPMCFWWAALAILNNLGGLTPAFAHDATGPIAIATARPKSGRIRAVRF